jgi:pyruvate/2-oxoglutarate dehydrogenase complex dihydrolipoamide acyltransferase (E2) component
MTGRLSAVAVVSLGLALAGACNEPPAPPPAPTKAPEPPKPAVAADAGAPKPKMVANPDGLSLADRIAKREAAEKKVAAELATAEHDRLLKYDRSKLAQHTQVFAFITKARAAWDALEPKLGGDKAKAKAAVEKLAGGQRASIVAMGKKMATIDPKGGNSNVTTDYDVMLNALANDYPEALVASLEGDPKPLAEQKVELDKRTKKIGDWLAELKKK